MQHEWAARRFYVYEIKMDKLILETNSVESNILFTYTDVSQYDM